MANDIDNCSSTDNAVVHIFRQAIEKIRELSLPPTPVVYAVLYDYMSGRNKNLNVAFDTIVKKRPIKLEDVQKLFTDFVAPSLAIDNDKKTNTIVLGVVSIVETLQNALNESSGNLSPVIQKIEKIQGMLSQTRREDLAMLVGAIISLSQSAVKTIQETSDVVTANNQQLENVKKAFVLAKKEATTDPLTGLLNRRGVEEKILEYHGKDKITTLAGVSTVLVLDLDHFKSLNDAYGHNVGDKVLKAVGEVLRLHTRGEDLAVRIGGEEFLVVLPNTPISSGNIVAEKLRKTIGGIRIKTNDSDIDTITASIGIDKYIFKPDNQSAISEFWGVVANADKALYQSKRDGRNRTTIFFS